MAIGILSITVFSLSDAETGSSIGPNQGKSPNSRIGGSRRWRGIPRNTPMLSGYVAKSGETPKTVINLLALSSMT